MPDRIKPYCELNDHRESTTLIESGSCILHQGVKEFAGKLQVIQDWLIMTAESNGSSAGWSITLYE